VPYSRIELQRERGHHVDRLRAYDVLIDGAHVGRLRPGETADYVVHAGRHVIRVRAKRRESVPLTIDAAPRGLVALTCRPTDDPLTVLSVEKRFRITLLSAET
jgi:hypothetical protein